MESKLKIGDSVIVPAGEAVLKIFLIFLSNYFAKSKFSINFAV